jgi:hypothetical protein
MLQPLESFSARVQSSTATILLPLVRSLFVWKKEKEKKVGRIEKATINQLIKGLSCRSKHV